MEKKNWIKESFEFIRKAMNKGDKIQSFNHDKYIWFEIGDCIEIWFGFEDEYFSLRTLKGSLEIPFKYSERDKLEIQAFHLTVKEYNEDMAISEFEGYFKTDDEPKTVNDLDDDDE
jgi:hypothetical protein